MSRMEAESESESDSQEYRTQHESKRLRQHVFDPYFKKIFCQSGFVKHMNQRCTGSNDSTSYILLCAAIQRNDNRSAVCLLRHYCKGNMGRPDPSKDIPLQLAVLAGNVDLVELLLDKGARVSVSFQDQRQPLHLICDRRSSPTPSELTRIAIARLLLEHGADANALERQNRDSPLILAVRGKQLELARFLLERAGSDRRHANKHQETALHVAFAENAGIEMIELLYEEDEPLQPSMFSHAVRHLMNSGFGSGSLLGFGEPLKPVQFLLRHGLSVDSRLDKRANRLLHMICQNHAAQTMPIFVEQWGAEVDARNEDGKTPLHFCAESQSARFVELLLERGAEVEALTDNRQSVLHFAAANKSAAVLELLLRRARGRLDVNAKAKDGNFTPLFNAVWANRRDNVRLLLDWQARVNERIINNQVVLHVAVDQKHLRIVELLLEHGADVNALDDYGNSPLSISLYQIADAVNSDWSDFEQQQDQQQQQQQQDQLRPVEAVQRVLTRHGARLFASAPQRLSEQSLRVLNNPHFKDAFDECLAELERIKESRLAPDCGPASLFQLLTDGSDKLVAYARNERFLEAFAAANCRQSFPIYGGALENSVRRTLDRLALLEVCSVSLNAIARSLDEAWLDTCLPCLVVEHLLSYLNITDLQNLAAIAE